MTRSASSLPASSSVGSTGATASRPRSSPTSPRTWSWTLCWLGCFSLAACVASPALAQSSAPIPTPVVCGDAPCALAAFAAAQAGGPPLIELTPGAYMTAVPKSPSKTK